MGGVLGMSRCIATHLSKRFSVTWPSRRCHPYQRFGSALNLNVHFHVVPRRSVRRASMVPSFPLGEGTIARAYPTDPNTGGRVGRYLERQGFGTGCGEQLSDDELEGGTMAQHWVRHLPHCRGPPGPQGLTLQTLPACDEPFDEGRQGGRVFLHAGVAARADQRQKLERLCGISVGRRSRAPVADAERQRPLSAEDTVPRRRRTSSSNPSRLPLPAWQPGGETAGQPEPFPASLRPTASTARG